MNIFVFGDDPEFNRDVYRGWKNVFIATKSRRRPVTAEWEFSKLYCDVVLLTGRNRYKISMIFVQKRPQLTAGG